MEFIIGIGLIILAMLLFFAVSSKQRIKTQQSRLAVLSQYPQSSRFLGILLLGLSLFPLCSHYGNSIGFIALYLLITPILLILIFIKRN